MGGSVPSIPGLGTEEHRDRTEPQHYNGRLKFEYWVSSARTVILLRSATSHIHILRSPWYKERTTGTGPIEWTLMGLTGSCRLTKLQRTWTQVLTGIELGSRISKLSKNVEQFRRTFAQLVEPNEKTSPALLPHYALLICIIRLKLLERLPLTPFGSEFLNLPKPLLEA